jgi:hypothetical protein
VQRITGQTKGARFNKTAATATKERKTDIRFIMMTFVKIPQLPSSLNQVKEDIR